MDKRKFLANYESLVRLKLWADRRLRALGQEEKGKAKGIGIWELDGRRALEFLSVSEPEYHMEQDQEFREILDEINSPKGREQSFLGNLKHCFRLSVAEELCLYLAVLPEMEGIYKKLFSWLNGNPKKTRPTLETAANVMGFNPLLRSTVREEMGERSPFVLYMMEPGWGQDREPFWDRELVLDPKIAEYLLGSQCPDKGLAGVSRTFTPEDQRESLPRSRYYEMLLHACHLCGLDRERESRLRKPVKEQRAVFLWGAMGCGKKELLRQLAAGTGKRILLLEADRVAEERKDLQEALRRGVREAVLTDSLLAVEHYESLKPEMEERFWEEMRFCPDPILVLSSEKPENKQGSEICRIPVHVENPSYEERRKIWGYYMEKYGLPTKEQNRLAAKFLFLPGQIKKAARHYQNSRQVLGEEKASLYESCFAQIRHQLYERATKINSGYTWNQLILPDSQKRLMRHICSQMENQYKVYEEWGFGRTVAYGKGVTVVFAGSPGTGKTMAAQILSKELDLELYKIDLSQMVSKYVGETEKNLASVFYEAELSNAILFFDEADSLFGRRTEVKSSNDRYANLETSYLLQRLEEYEGMTILATNYLKNIDDAFMRRMKYIIQFPFPDKEARTQIWKVTIPEKAPMGQDMDYDFLGERLELSGGSIKNIAVYAAFLAADKGCVIGMKEILEAARYEMQKTGKILLGKDLQQYGYLLEED